MEEDTLYTFLDISYGNGLLFRQPVHLYIDQPVQVEEKAAGHEIIRIWPNPARDIMNFDFSDLNPGKSYSLSLHDASGRMLETLIIRHSQKNTRISVNDYLPGMYFAILREDGQTIANQKVMISR
jgi:hypothetical protein